MKWWLLGLVYITRRRKRKALLISEQKRITFIGPPISRSKKARAGPMSSTHPLDPIRAKLSPSPYLPASSAPSAPSIPSSQILHGTSSQYRYNHLPFLLLAHKPHLLRPSILSRLRGLAHFCLREDQEIVVSGRSCGV